MSTFLLKSTFENMIEKDFAKDFSTFSLLKVRFVTDFLIESTTSIIVNKFLIILIEKDFLKFDFVIKTSADELISISLKSSTTTSVKRCIDNEKFSRSTVQSLRICWCNLLLNEKISSHLRQWKCFKIEIFDEMK